MATRKRATRQGGLRTRRKVELGVRGELRAEQFLQAATEIFLEKGYRNARLADIVGIAGGSLSTLYQVFGNKEGLVRAIMERSIRIFGQGLDVLEDPDLPPEQALVAAAERLVTEILTPEQIVTSRIFVAEGLHFPGLRDWFFENGVAPAEKRLAAYFEREKALGRLMVDSPAVAADRFFMMVFGGTMIRSVNGAIGCGDVDRAVAESREAVAIFLRGVLPR